MTLQEYINNPLGKTNALIPHREMYRQLYADKLNKIMVRENGQVNYTLYESSDAYICHIKVPSEVVDKFYYDVVIKFKKEKGIKNLLDSQVKFYSNDPSFVFTFAHAFIKNKMFIEELEDKMSKEAVKERAYIRNPKDQVGYVKSLYFAYLLMQQRGLFNPVKYEIERKPYSDRILKSNIMHADEKIRLRQEAQEKLNKKKSDNKEIPKPRRQDIIHPSSGDTTPVEKPTVSYTNRVGTIGSVKTTKNTNKINKINNVKKTKKV